MKKLFVVTLIVLLVMSLSVFGQEKKQMGGAMEAGGQEKMMDEMPDMKPPQPLSGDWYNWMIGEWEGTSKSAMGVTKDWIKFEWGLDQQFVVMHYKGETVEANEEMMKGMQEQMNMSDEDMEMMMQMPYKGMGVVTKDPKTGESMGYWFDNWRTVSEGTGKMDGANKMTMVWKGAMGTETRTTEKVSENKMKVTFKSSGPMGEFEGTSELTKVSASQGSASKIKQGSGTKEKK